MNSEIVLMLEKCVFAFEPHCDKTACAPSLDSYQPGHPPSLIRVFAVRLKKARILIYPLSTQRRLWSDWANAQADLSLHLAHMPFCWFCHDVAHPVMCPAVEGKVSSVDLIDQTAPSGYALCVYVCPNNRTLILTLDTYQFLLFLQVLQCLWKHSVLLSDFLHW